MDKENLCTLSVGLRIARNEGASIVDDCVVTNCEILYMTAIDSFRSTCDLQLLSAAFNKLK